MKWPLIAFMLVTSGCAQMSEPQENLPAIGQTLHCTSATGAVIIAQIGSVDRVSTGDIVHVSLWADTPDSMTVSHAPFSLAALEVCAEVPVRETRVTTADFQNGYNTWRTASEAHEAGVWSISPADAYEGIVAVMANTDTAEN